MELHSEMSPLLLSISAVVVGVISVLVKMQMRTLTLYQDFPAQKTIMCDPDAKQRLAFYKCYTTTLTHGQK